MGGSIPGNIGWILSDVGKISYRAPMLKKLVRDGIPQSLRCKITGYYPKYLTCM
jgi:hypothetical protein